jgi:hypothetical protein
MRESLAVRLVCVLFPLLSASVGAQKPVRISGGPTCKSCTLRASLVFSVPDEIDAAGQPAWVSRDSRNQYFFFSPWTHGKVFIHDESGKRIGEFGREGRGPGEYWGHPDVNFDGDTIHVFDGGLSRHTVLSSSFEVIRTGPMAVVGPRCYLLPGDRLLSTTHIREGVDQRALVIGDSRGKVVREFGPRIASRSPDDWISRWWSFSEPRNGMTWVAPINRYVLEKWDTAGRRRAIIERDAPWFVTWDDLAFYEPNVKRPRPSLGKVREDKAGLLWILTHVADSGWKARDGTPTQTEGGMMNRVHYTQFDEFFDTIVEIIDPKRGVLLASKRLPQYFYDFAGDGIVWSLREDKDGIAHIDVHRLAFKR